MAADASQTCPSCGARVAADRDRCDLCGADVQAAPESADASDAPDADVPDPDAPLSQDAASTAAAPSPDPSPDPLPAAAASPDAVFCNDCGWKNPAGANFCSRCGTALETVRDAAPPPTDDLPDGTRRVSADALDAASGPALPPSDDDASPPDEADDVQQEMAQNLTLLVGGAVLVLVALFFVTLWSQNQNWGSDDPPPSPQTPTQSGARSPGGSGGAQAPPLTSDGGTFAPTDLATLAQQTQSPMPDPLARRVDSVRTAMDAASGSEKRRLRQELANLYVGAGQMGQAAVQQLEIARTTDDTEAWRNAADRLYAWMQTLQQQGQRQQAFPVAEEAASAYSTIVERAPDDLTAHTRMGEAYLLTNSPMRGIQTINDVLDTDSTFVPARFQKGLALLQISRFDQAIDEFERVKQFAGEGTPYYQQADRAIQIIRERTTSSSPPSSSSAPRP